MKTIEFTIVENSEFWEMSDELKSEYLTICFNFIDHLIEYSLSLTSRTGTTDATGTGRPTDF